MDSQAVPGTRPPSLLSRMKVTSEHQDTDKSKSKTKQNPNYPQTPDPRSPCVWRPAGMHFVTWSGAGRASGTGRGRTRC